MKMNICSIVYKYISKDHLDLWAIQEQQVLKDLRVIQVKCFEVNKVCDSSKSRINDIHALIFKGLTGPMGPPGFPGPRGEMGLRGPPVSLIVKMLLFDMNFHIIRAFVHVLGYYHLFNQQPHPHYQFHQVHPAQIKDKVCIYFSKHYQLFTTFIFQISDPSRRDGKFG